MNWFMFFIGFFSMFRVHLIGMIGISELLICLSAPFFFVQDFQTLRRDGFMPMCTMMILTCIGCLVAIWYNNTIFDNAIRGFATPVVFFCSFVFFHHYLRRDFGSLKWLMVGLMLSVPLPFLLEGSFTDDLALLSAGADTTGSNYLLSVLVYPIFVLPVLIFYKKLPTLASVAILSAGGLFKALISESGRSSALSLFAAALLIYIGNKSIKKMGIVRKHFARFLLLGILSIYAAKTVYSFAASRGYMGEGARMKYMVQTGGDSGMLKLLVGGRVEAFVCIYAALDHPIVGFGPWALDVQGYRTDFLKKYGLWDYEEEARNAMEMARLGYGSKIAFIPAHSYIFGNWVWYGIFGLLLWIYVIYVIFKFFKSAPDAVPQWWPIIAITVPRMLWDIFFSPFSTRVSNAATIAMLLFAIAVAKRRIAMNRSDWEESLGYAR